MKSRTPHKLISLINKREMLNQECLSLLKRLAAVQDALVREVSRDPETAKSVGWLLHGPFGLDHIHAPHKTTLRRSSGVPTPHL